MVDNANDSGRVAAGMIKHVLNDAVAKRLKDYPQPIVQDVTIVQSKVNFDGGGALSTNFVTAGVTLNAELSEAQACAARLILNRHRAEQMSGFGINFDDGDPAPAAA